MGTSKKDLIERWTTIEGSNLLKKIITCLKKQKTLSEIIGIEKINDKLDLRGINFPKEYSEYTYKGKFVKQITGSLKFKSAILENIDLSYADIRHTEWKNCTFKNIVFYMSQMQEMTITNCEFEDVEFNNTKLSYSYLNIRSGKNSGSFKNVKFKKTHLNETRFSFPKFENCSFEDCNFHAADFDGSRFKECNFKGKVNSPWFRKHSIKEFEPNYFINQIDKRKIENEMENIDFSKAILDYVSFSKDLDLQKCKFENRVIFRKLPNNDNEIYAITDEGITPR